MASRRARPSKGGTGAIKAFITTVALAGTLGGWARLTVEADQSEEPEPTPTPRQYDLPPLPTVVPPPSDIDAPIPTSAPATPALRRVDAPPASPSGGGGGGGGGGSPSSNSRSSR